MRLSAAQTSFADPRIDEEFGTWFRDLRAELRRKRSRGHNNPVKVLGANGLPATTDVYEVVDPAGHIIRLEEMKRAALESAEEQWRQFASRHGSLPRGPAVAAIRRTRQILLQVSTARAVEASESSQRAKLEDARTHWLSELALRAEYELDCLASYARRVLYTQADQRLHGQISRSEAVARAHIEDAAYSWYRVVGLHHSAELAALQRRAVDSFHSSVLRRAPTVLALLLDEERDARMKLEACEQQYRRLADDIRVAHLSELAATLRGVVAAIEGCTEQLLQIIERERRERRVVEDAYHSYVTGIRLREAQQRNSIQRAVVQATARSQQWTNTTHRAIADMIHGEASLRDQITGAYDNWVKEVVQPELLCQKQQLMRSVQRWYKDKVAWQEDLAALVESERLARRVLEQNFVFWIENHFAALEVQERSAIPVNVARRLQEQLQHAAQAALLWARSPIHVLLDEEYVVRSRIAEGEARWRNEFFDTRLRQLLAEATPKGGIQRIRDDELSARTLIARAEEDWRRFVLESHAAGLAKASLRAHVGGAVKKSGGLEKKLPSLKF